MSAELYIGLISGTSMDGIDAVLVQFDDDGCRIHQTHHLPYTPELHRDLRAAVDAGNDDSNHINLIDVGALDIRVAHAFADATRALLAAGNTDADDVIAIGSHGQTVLHRPDDPQPFSMQLGDPGTLAGLTGITTVADFRNADIALGGQGAPLTSGFHAWLCPHDAQAQAVVNIGGIANVTLISGRGDLHGHDTGPGNTLLDDWCRRSTGQPYDDAGCWSGGGTVDSRLLETMLDDPYFAQPAPKSTGLDYFNGGWTDGQIARVNSAPAAQDVQATLAELTAVTIASDLRDVTSLKHVALCGGGAHNRDLTQRLARLLPQYEIETIEPWGIGPDWIEAAAFAWLARQRLRGIPTNVPQVTGARGAVSLGGVWLPANVS